MSKDKVIYVLVGIPGSGKSTRRRLLQLQHPNATIISTDDFVEGFAASVGSTYNEVFPTAVKYTAEYIDRVLAYALEMGKDIIWDQTNLTVKKRKTILNRIPDSYEKVVIFIDTSLNVSLQNNNERERKVPEEVIKRMYHQLEIPHLNEGFDNIIKYVHRKKV